MLRDLFRNLRNLLPGKAEPWRGSGGPGANRLRWWICFSGALHLVLILTLLVAPTSTARRELPVPVYTVDLVAGSMPAPRAEPPSPRRQDTKPAPLPPLDEDPLDEVAVEPAVPDPPETVEAPKIPAPPKKEARAPKPKKEAPPTKKVKKASKKPKKKVVKKKPVKPKNVVKRKKPARKSPAKLAKKTSRAPKPKRDRGKDSRLIQRLKERRIGDALATAKERARLQREARAAKGTGAGSGTAAAGTGLVRDREFVLYWNTMLGRIKEHWTWFDKRRDLEVTVGFGVGVDGEIFGLKLLKSSGDASYDDSVVRAVKGASPLPQPPARYAREFGDVEILFRPDPSDG